MKAFSPLSTGERKQLFKATAAMPQQVESLLNNVSELQMKHQSGDGFSLHEHLWHLVDLEIQAFAPRFYTLLSETSPVLDNFDGDAVARQRQYHSLPLVQGLHSFSETRLKNLWLLSGVNAVSWMRSGVQEDLGLVSLADVFRSMREHDQSHLMEMKTLVDQVKTYNGSSKGAAA